MQGFYFFVKFGLVLIYILKVYRKKSSSILLRKNMFNSLLAFCFWKACTFSSFERFLCWKSRNYSQIYLSRIINYWDSILTLYITWRAFSLVCFLSVFFFLSFFFWFFFLSVFFLTGNLSSNRFPKRIRKKGCFIFLKEIEIRSDILICINIQWVFQTDIDYIRC